MTSIDGKQTCDRCEKAFTENMELERSDEHSEIYCSPDCATDAYFEYALSHPITFGEMQKIRTVKNTFSEFRKVIKETGKG